MSNIDDLKFDAALLASPEPNRNRVLHLRSIREVLAEVATMGSRPWLVRGLWPRDAPGAQAQSGKPGVHLDLAFSVAAGVPFLGQFDCPNPGPVTLFLGEGGMAG